MTCQLSNLNLDKIIRLYENFSLNEYNDEEPVSLVDFFRTKSLPLAYMECSNEEFELQVNLDLKKMAVVQEVQRGGRIIQSFIGYEFSNEEELYEFMENLDYDELTEVDIDYGKICFEYVENENNFEVITENEVSRIISHYQEDEELMGSYICKTDKGYIAVDNTTQDCWTEAFRTLEGAKAYIAGFRPEFVQEIEEEEAS